MDSTLSFETLRTIIETAGLYLAEPGDPTDGDPDGVTLRPEYGGRYGAEGFGLVVNGSSALPLLMAAAGVTGAFNDDQSGGFGTDDALQLARSAESDAMGRSGTILYWSGWSVTGLPDGYNRS